MAAATTCGPATLLGAFAMAAIGCMSTRTAAVQRASAEFSCPEDRVTSTPRPDISGGTYDVSACGQVARYTCAQNPNLLDPTCVRERYP